MTEQMIQSLPELPKGWVWTILSEIAQINPPLPHNELSDDLEVSFLPMKAVEEETGKYDVALSKKYSEVKKGYTPFINGDVIFAKITPCMENGKIAVLDNLKNGIGFGSTEFHVIRCLKNCISNRFIFFYLLQEVVRKDAETKMKGTAGQLRVPASYVQSRVLPLPPVQEQKRIVAKFEELFTTLDAGVEALKKAKVQLKRYRQSVLKSAFEGKLTEQWRRQNKDKIEPASLLVERIKEERRKSGKKFEEMLPVDTSELPQLPRGWIWTRVDLLCDSQTGPFGTQLHRSDYTDVGVPTIEIGDVHPDRDLREGTTHFISKEKALSLKRFEVRNGDVLFSRVGTVGRCTIVPVGCDGWIMSTSLIRVRVISTDLLSKYLLYYFQSPISQYFTRKTTKGTTRAGTNSKIVGELPLIVPPLQEQKKIAEEIERLFSIADQSEHTIEYSLAHAARLRQSILKQAFEGKLAPQDPTDEPASVLLDRIKAEKAKHEDKNKDENEDKARIQKRRNKQHRIDSRQRRLV